MRIDNKVFESHGFRLRNYFFRNAPTWDSGKAWVKNESCFMFVTTDENGQFDDSYEGCFVKPGKNFSSLLFVLDSNDEIHNMVRETEEIDEESEEEPPQVLPSPEPMPVGGEESRILREVFNKTVQRFSMRRIANDIYSKGRIRLYISRDVNCNDVICVTYKDNLVADIYEDEILYWNDIAYDYVVVMEAFLSK